ncbi:MAG: ABC transporter ATP-binding protein/permease, partial [Bauldia sp.]|nr:ABC transporter ATP-binding protein/permease [Bauldia sp.]
MTAVAGANSARPPKVKPESTFQTLGSLWPYMWPTDRPDLKQRVALALGVLIAAKIVTVLVPYTYKWATDALLTPPEGAAAAANLGLAVLITVPIMLVVANGVGRILSNVFNNLRDALFAKVGQHAVRQLAYKTFVHMHELSLRYHLQRRTGGLSRIIERGVSGIETIVRFTILNTAPTVIEFLLAAAVIAYQFDWIYLAVIAVTVWLYVWFTVKASDWRIKIRRTMNESDNDANSKAIDSLLNFETVKYFGNEKMEARRFDRAMERYEGAAVRIWTSLAWLNIGQIIIFTAGMTVCMVLSGTAVMRGEQTIGDFVLINALLMQLSIPLNFIGFVYREIKQGLIDVEQMFALLDVAPEIVDKPDARPLVVRGGNVRFDDVVFHYDAARPIIRGITFEVPDGRTIAIVGPSGAGKSTISRLLFRFYDVTGGRITIDGQDVRDVTQESLRAAIGMVPQDTVLFNDTIRYNIRYGRPEATDEEVAAAAGTAQIADFIDKLPDGYGTEVGERGLKLSGGEKQRVAIARTVLKAPPILILDEATSAL